MYVGQGRSCPLRVFSVPSRPAAFRARWPHFLFSNGSCADILIGIFLWGLAALDRTVLVVTAPC